MTLNLQQRGVIDSTNKNTGNSLSVGMNVESRNMEVHDRFSIVHFSVCNFLSTLSWNESEIRAEALRHSNLTGTNRP